MGGHEVGLHVLIPFQLGVDLDVFRQEALVDPVLRLAHQPQHPLRHVLRRGLQPAADVVAAQLFQHSPVVLVRQQVIEAHAGTDEDLFHSGQLPQPPQQLHIFAVVGLHIRAGGGK